MGMRDLQDKPLTRRDHASIEDTPHIRGTHGFKAVSAAYTATSRDWFIIVDASSAAVTITLPPALSMKFRGELNIKKIDSSSNAVTIDGHVSETIDGTTTKVIAIQYVNITLISDGSNWYIK